MEFGNEELDYEEDLEFIELDGEFEDEAIQRAAEWSRNNFKWIAHWGEGGKEHHRKLCNEGNYR